MVSFRSLHTDPSLPWLYFGDFNEVLFSAEFDSRNSRASWQMNSFWDALNYCQLNDLGFRGRKLTWKRLSIASFTQRARLNHFIDNLAWITLYPWSTVQHIPSIHSDHPCLYFQFGNHNPHLNEWGSGKPFRF